MNCLVNLQSRSDTESLTKGRLAKSPPLADDRIEQLFETLTLKVLSRLPLEDEKKAAVAFVKQKQKDNTSHQTIWASVARSLFASCRLSVFEVAPIRKFKQCKQLNSAIESCRSVRVERCCNRLVVVSVG